MNKINNSIKLLFVALLFSIGNNIFSMDEDYTQREPRTAEQLIKLFRDAETYPNYAAFAKKHGDKTPLQVLEEGLMNSNFPDNINIGIANLKVEDLKKQHKRVESLWNYHKEVLGEEWSKSPEWVNFTEQSAMIKTILGNSK